jgi:FdrA protein
VSPQQGDAQPVDAQPVDAQPVDHVELRPGAYHDSVTLLQVSRALANLDGVLAAQVAMATGLNMDVLGGMGFVLPAGARPNGRVVAVRARTADAVLRALFALEQALASGGDPEVGADVGTGSTPPSTEPSRTTAAALARHRTPLVVVSVPGEHAYVEALDAVRAGSSVLLFSDNVSIEQEVALKDLAVERDVLVMGPDCGTAVIGGVGLGFANVVRPGQVSLVAASGTGAQQVMALLDHAGVGVRHCLGLGGRDLSAAVGGRSARQALAALARDPGTELVVLVGKPADPDVLADLERLVAELGLAVEWATIGPGLPDLTASVERVLDRLGVSVPTWPRWPAEGSPATPTTAPGLALRGLFCGGTLCQEALLVAGGLLGPGPAALGHSMEDLGDDTLTRGRAHPMIDPTLRDDRLAREAADPRVGAILVDVVLGHGSHPDPAAGLVPLIRSARAGVLTGARDLAVVVSLTGTRDDPQGLLGQATRLAEAGAEVYLSNAQAARAAAGHVLGRTG